jgi:hypothetical protein
MVSLPRLLTQEVRPRPSDPAQNGSHTMIAPKDFPALSREELLALVAELQRQITDLRASYKALRPEIEQLKRGGKRQATPADKGNRVA